MSKSKVAIFVVSILLAAFSAFPVAAAEYRNSEYGFIVSYPDAWQAKDSQKPILLYASASSLIPWILINIADGATFPDALNAATTSWKITELKAMPAVETTTGNGVKAITTKITFTTHTGYEAEGFVLGARRDSRWIIINVATVPSGEAYDEDDFSKIAKSLKFNK